MKSLFSSWTAKRSWAQKTLSNRLGQNDDARFILKRQRLNRFTRIDERTLAIGAANRFTVDLEQPRVYIHYLDLCDTGF